MNQSMLDRLRGALRVLNGTIDLGSMIPVEGYWDVKVVRADGTIEERTLKNIVTAAGLNRLANRAIGETNTPLYVLGVGTVTAAASLGSTNFGEVANGARFVQAYAHPALGAHLQLHEVSGQYVVYRVRADPGP